MKKIIILINLPLKLRREFYTVILSNGSVGSLGLAICSAILLAVELGLLYLIKPSIFTWLEKIFNPTNSKSFSDSLGLPIPFILLFFVNAVALGVDCFYFYARRNKNDTGSIATSVR